MRIKRTENERDRNGDTLLGDVDFAYWRYQISTLSTRIIESLNWRVYMSISVGFFVLI